MKCICKFHFLLRKENDTFLASYLSLWSWYSHHCWYSITRSTVWMNFFNAKYWSKWSKTVLFAFALLFKVLSPLHSLSLSLSRSNPSVFWGLSVASLLSLNLSLSLSLSKSYFQSYSTFSFACLSTSSLFFFLFLSLSVSFSRFPQIACHPCFLHPFTTKALCSSRFLISWSRDEHNRSNTWIQNFEMTCIFAQTRCYTIGTIKHYGFVFHWKRTDYIPAWINNYKSVVFWLTGPGRPSLKHVLDLIYSSLFVGQTFSLLYTIFPCALKWPSL